MKRENELLLVLTLHEDPGHSWLEVSKKQMEGFGVIPSSCSYERGNSIFLEEDCDAPLFIGALIERKMQFGIRRTVYNNMCFIRELKHYDASFNYMKMVNRCQDDLWKEINERTVKYNETEYI